MHGRELASSPSSFCTTSSTAPPMAMSDASSTPAEWTQQLYRRNSLAPRPSHQPVVSSATFDALPGSTAPAVAPTSSSTTVINGAATASSAQPGIEGRVSKPARRRTRASRRAPTTLLNTDTTNFRAMVQQFTGIPSGPYSTSSAPYRPGGAPPPPAPPAMINYGINYSDPLGRANLMPQLGHVQQQQQQFQGHQQQHYQQVQFQPNGSVAGVGSNDAFLQGFGDHGDSNLDVGDGGLFFHDMPNHQMMPRATSTNNRTDGYFS